MTTFTVPRTARPISETMFADLGIPLVSFTATAAGIEVTCPETLTPANIIRGRIRLLTPDAAQEGFLVAAMSALAANDAYLANGSSAYLALPSPTTAQAVAQVRANTIQLRANTAQLRGLILHIGRDVLQ